MNCWMVDVRGRTWKTFFLFGFSQVRQQVLSQFLEFSSLAEGRLGGFTSHVSGSQRPHLPVN